MADVLDEIRDIASFRAKVVAIVRNGGAPGDTAATDNPLRTVEQQRTLVTRGYPKTMRTKHLPSKDGMVSAVDIVHAQLGRHASARVSVMIAQRALTQGYDVGSLWGLPRSMRSELGKCQHDRSTEFDPLKWEGRITRDPAHVQMRTN